MDAHKAQNGEEGNSRFLRLNGRHAMVRSRRPSPKVNGWLHQTRKIIRLKSHLPREKKWQRVEGASPAFADVIHIRLSALWGSGGGGRGEAEGEGRKAERCHVWEIFPPFFFNCHQREFNGVYMGLARAGRHLGAVVMIVS